MRGRLTYEKILVPAGYPSLWYRPCELPPVVFPAVSWTTCQTALQSFPDNNWKAADTQLLQNNPFPPWIWHVTKHHTASAGPLRRGSTAWIPCIWSKKAGPTWHWTHSMTTIPKASTGLETCTTQPTDEQNWNHYHFKATICLESFSIETKIILMYISFPRQ